MRALPLIAALTSACHSALPSPGAAPIPATNVRVEFRAASDSFAAARDDYERIWASDGSRMIAALERSAGLQFAYPEYADTAITVTVREVASNSGYRARSGMVMRASYSADTKKATLMHELGHRLMAGLFFRGEEEHDELFLWLYDAWIALYGKDFADAQVVLEKRRGGPYPAAWNYALSLSPAERAAAWKKVLAERLPRRLAQ
ncbi:MAG TPA: hypothetical protein VJ717_12290 [Gemmatimonadaceae bacterium]|nr:hypothetical protein [Gemmatimonadaceae bacterium]